MMTNKDYQEIVEKKYGKPLKEIMYELCVIRDVVPWEGASELGVPKSTFLSWRNKFRFGPIQRRADFARQMRDNTINKYKQELEDIDFERDFIYKDEKTIRGFKEIMERLLELERYKRTLLDDADTSSDILITMKIATIEQTLNYLMEYEQGKLHEEFNRERERIHYGRK
ncbi:MULTISPECIES: hypothetical protein [Bacillaceae]|jgi:hypothetical protein|uniref:Uncharacterized protein n=3 Tax=Geobacillus TaxID=129337 RepID=A0A150NF83_GEOSE|nr:MULTISPECIES: hypothetical protein [Bacillaceae]QAV27747.1 hypothetical protein BTDUT50_14835 [Neobacillus thermocopriae]AWO73143.1 hypothetical protein C1N76_00170 [Geobacillus thermoleovorans]KYD35380.1 hypothetical protein B4114_1193 [Geobacillus stearothermophilus]MED3668813.1 hypothetical protein [Geobacillus kaustophilus]NNU91659.1 hypothetical protein [Anoxybacillus sp. CHMUD]